MVDPIYWLEPDIKECDRLRYGKGMGYQTIVCKRNSTHSSAQTRPTPLRVEFRGVALTDFVWTSYNEAIVDKEVAAIFQGAKINGCEFLPINLENTMGDQMSGDFYELRPVGWGGMADARSGIQLVEECPYCKHRVFSGYTNPNQLFDANAWDGSDVFTIWPLPRYIMITETVRRLITKSQLTGVKVSPLSKFPRAIAGTLTPGHVHDWFDKNRVPRLDREVDLAVEKL